MTDIGGVDGRAVLAALELIETDASEWPEPLLDTWSEGTLAQAFSVLIFGAMKVATPKDGDCLHLIVPAVITRLRNSGHADKYSLPVMAGVLTVAALGGDPLVGDDPSEWRFLFGAPSLRELSAWRETTRLLVGMADTLAYREQGAFARLTAELIADSGAEE